MSEEEGDSGSIWDILPGVNEREDQPGYEDPDSLTQGERDREEFLDETVEATRDYYTGKTANEIDPNDPVIGERYRSTGDIVREDAVDRNDFRRNEEAIMLSDLGKEALMWASTYPEYTLGIRGDREYYANEYLAQLVDFRIEDIVRALEDDYGVDQEVLDWMLAESGEDVRQNWVARNLAPFLSDGIAMIKSSQSMHGVGAGYRTFEESGAEKQIGWESSANPLVVSTPDWGDLRSYTGADDSFINRFIPQTPEAIALELGIDLTAGVLMRGLVRGSRWLRAAYLRRVAGESVAEIVNPVLREIFTPSLSNQLRGIGDGWGPRLDWKDDSVDWLNPYVANKDATLDELIQFLDELESTDPNMGARLRGELNNGPEGLHPSRREMTQQEIDLIAGVRNTMDRINLELEFVEKVIDAPVPPNRITEVDPLIVQPTPAVSDINASHLFKRRLPELRAQWDELIAAEGPYAIGGDEVYGEYIQMQYDFARILGYEIEPFPPLWEVIGVSEEVYLYRQLKYTLEEIKKIPPDIIDDLAGEGQRINPGELQGGTTIDHRDGPVGGAFEDIYEEGRYTYEELVEVREELIDRITRVVDDADPIEAHIGAAGGESAEGLIVWDPDELHAWSRKFFDELEGSPANLRDRVLSSFRHDHPLGGPALSDAALERAYEPLRRDESEDFVRWLMDGGGSTDARTWDGMMSEMLESPYINGLFGSMRVKWSPRLTPDDLGPLPGPPQPNPWAPSEGVARITSVDELMKKIFPDRPSGIGGPPSPDSVPLFRTEASGANLLESMEPGVGPRGSNYYQRADGSIARYKTQEAASQTVSPNEWGWMSPKGGDTGAAPYYFITQEASELWAGTLAAIRRNEITADGIVVKWVVEGTSKRMEMTGFANGEWVTLPNVADQLPREGLYPWASDGSHLGDRIAETFDSPTILD